MIVCVLFKRERKELVKERDNLKAEEDAELKQAVQANVKKVSGRTISEEDSEILSEDLQKSDEFREMYDGRCVVEEEVNKVHIELDSVEDNLKNISLEDDKFISSLSDEQSIENFDDFDLSGTDLNACIQGVNDIQGLTSELNDEIDINSSASLRTSFN